MVFNIVQKGGKKVEERLGQGRLGNGGRSVVGMRWVTGSTTLSIISLLSLCVLFQRCEKEGDRTRRKWCGRGSLEREGKGNIPVFFTFVKENTLFLPLHLSQVIASFTRTV